VCARSRAAHEHVHDQGSVSTPLQSRSATWKEYSVPGTTDTVLDSVPPWDVKPTIPLPYMKPHNRAALSSFLTRSCAG
jgi:hypothetical protein